MKQRTRVNNSYFIIILLLLGMWFAMSYFTSNQENYTRAEFVKDMEAGVVQKVVISPNNGLRCFC